MKCTACGKECDPIESRKPLFSSLDRFDSCCGRPIFTKALEPENVEERLDTSHNMIRTEVRSGRGDRHWGHLFDDSLLDQGGLRYSIAFASWPFSSLEEIESEGDGEYRRLFEREHKAQE
jgi:methionine-R-sulfoxide reductase